MDKTVVTVADRIEPQVNRYYLKVSRRYMGAGIFLMLLLILYVVCVMLFFGEYVTYENLRYLVRDWNAMSLPGSEEFTDIVYNASDDTKFRYFRSGLAVCGTDAYLYYDASGIQLIDDPTGFSDPSSAASGKYMLVYDIGGKEYAVYNQLTRILSREAEGSIIAADIADDGSMVIVSRSRETRFVAEVYNAAFSKVMNIHKENYVLDAAVSPDGQYVILCSAVPADTDFNAEVELCRVGSSEHVAITNYAHTMPLDVLAKEDGFVLLCDNGLYFFSYDGRTTGSVSFEGMSLSYADMNSHSCAVVGSVNALGTRNHILVYDGAGNKLYDKILDSRVTGAYASRDTGDALLYLTTPDSVLKLLPDGSVQTHKPDSGEILAVVPLEDGALICQESGAYPWQE
ncbi:MAG: hypothetical protein IJC71_03095 [Clostridia bacterium]|nr:hypothetical protein [Clostridia bacterium]